MALHLTKVAFGITTLDQLVERLRCRAAEGGGEAALVTRFLPKRHEEIAGQGSLYWIVKHQLIARSPIVGFGEAAEGKVAIRLDPALVLVQTQHKRAHQGWRYLETEAAPVDLGGGDADGLAALPPALQGALAELALI